MSEQEIKQGHKRFFSVHLFLFCEYMAKFWLIVLCYRGVEMDVSRGTIVIANPKAPQEAARTFTYDAVYDWK